jgi:hypothetical protein
MAILSAFSSGLTLAFSPHWSWSAFPALSPYTISCVSVPSNNSTSSCCFLNSGTVHGLSGWDTIFQKKLLDFGRSLVALWKLSKPCWNIRRFSFCFPHTLPTGGVPDQFLVKLCNNIQPPLKALFRNQIWLLVMGNIYNYEKREEFPALLHHRGAGKQNNQPQTNCNSSKQVSVELICSVQQWGQNDTLKVKTTGVELKLYAFFSSISWSLFYTRFHSHEEPRRWRPQWERIHGQNLFNSWRSPWHWRTERLPTQTHSNTHTLFHSFANCLGDSNYAPSNKVGINNQ